MEKARLELVGQVLTIELWVSCHLILLWRPISLTHSDFCLIKINVPGLVSKRNLIMVSP